MERYNDKLKRESELFAKMVTSELKKTIEHSMKDFNGIVKDKCEKLSSSNKKAKTEQIYFKVSEASQRLNICSAKLYRQIRSGELPSYEIAGSMRLHIDDLKSLVRKKE